MPGAGKTYLMMRKGLKYMKKGRQVYANFPLEGAVQFKQLTEVFEVSNAVILIDEAGLVLPAQAWKDIPHEVMSYWCQHRHQGVELYYTCQNFKQVANGLRMVTQFRNRVSRIGSPRKPFIIKWKTTDNSGREKFGGGFTFFDAEIAKKYDTRHNVAKQAYLENGKGGARKGSSVDVQA